MHEERTEHVFLIGGASLYDQFFAKGLVDRVELTLIDGHHEGDIYVQEFRSGFRKTQEESFPK